MDYIRNTTDIHFSEPTVLSLGKFDGLHMGHKLLLDQVMKKKREGLKAVMFTFDIPPREKVEQKKARVLTTNDEKMHVFSRTGIDCLVEYPFTEEVKAMEPEDFIRMLVECFQIRCIVAGKDFHFGHKRRGDFNTLQECGKKFGFEVIVVEKKQYKGRDISSTFIREEIRKGDMETANQLLGYEYFVKGLVIHGRKLGRTIGIPTVNMIPEDEKLLPPFGVYVTRTIIDGRSYGGITNVGKKPTIEGENPVGIETHIFGFDEDVYGQELDVQFLSFLRKERKFSSVDQLTEQMKRDISYAKEYLKGYLKKELHEAVHDGNMAFSILEEEPEENLESI